MPLVYTDGSVSSNPVLFANDAFLAMIGADREDILGLPVASLFDDTTHSQSISLLKETMAQHGSGTWQFNLRRATNSTFLVAVYLTPFEDKVIGLSRNILTFFDVAALLCLSPKEKHFQSRVYDRAPGFIACTSGENHVFTYTNASYDEFVQKGDLVGMPVAKAIPELADQGIVDILDEVYRTGVPFQGSEMHMKLWNPVFGDFEDHWIDVVYHPMRDDSGQISGLFCEGYDVTEVRQVNDVLDALQSRMIHVSRVNAMGTMAATLAHELNQPLSAVSNYIEGARPMDGSSYDTDRLVTALKGIEESSRRAHAIIENIRQLTRHRKPAEEPFNLKQAVDDCVKLVHSSCPPSTRLLNEVPDDLIMLADRIKIQQVLINLMLNACEAMTDAPHPSITIEAREEKGRLIVCVTDTGPGIPAEVEETLFSWSESSKPDGMGLGLSICRTIVESHNGNIWLEKSDPSEGSSLCFSVPAMADK